MDQIDRTLLAALQEDATLKVSELAERVHLSTTACWKRIQNLEASGVRSRVALLDARALNVGVTVFVAIKTNQPTPRGCAASRVCRRSPRGGVLPHERHIDYLLRVGVPTSPATTGLQAPQPQHRSIRRELRFAMEQLKYTPRCRSPILTAGAGCAKCRKSANLLSYPDESHPHDTASGPSSPAAKLRRPWG